MVELSLRLDPKSETYHLRASGGDGLMAKFL